MMFSAIQVQAYTALRDLQDLLNVTQIPPTALNTAKTYFTIQCVETCLYKIRIKNFKENKYVQANKACLQDTEKS